MKPTSVVILLLLLGPPAAFARQHHDEPQNVNVNSRYAVESVSLAGVAESEVSASLRADMDKLVGQKYDQTAVNDLAGRMRKELHHYSVNVRVKRGEKPESVKIAFEAEKERNRRFDVHLPPVVYYSAQGWSGALVLAGETHHNFFSAGLLSTIDELLERNAGYELRYEHRRVGTDAVQVGVEYDRYHPTFESPTLTALATRPDIPYAYRIRQDFAPSVSVLPLDALKVTFGTSFQDLQMEVPTIHTERAYAFTADVRFRQRVRAGGLRHAIAADYSLRKATTALDSDLVYTRHLVSGDYTISIGRHLFGGHFKGGDIEGEAPLFERFSLGNSVLLRGWSKFDVAPLGGSRLAYGSLEYRYRPFQLFYDFGSVWDPGQTVTVRHSIGVGVISHGCFLSVAFPVRLNDVTPVVMFGVRY